MNARRSSRRTSHSAPARHARIRAREPAERISDALDRFEARYEEAKDHGQMLDILAAAYDWLRAEVKLVARELDPDREGWAEDHYAYDAIMAVAGVARNLSNAIREEVSKL